MYKVFIDNLIVQLVSPDEISPESVDGPVFIHGVDPVSERIELLVNQAETGVITVVCQDVNKVFSHLFEDYTYLEAAGGIVRKEDSFLIIRRLGKWDIPKGKMDKGETPEKTAVREIEEECGIHNLKIVSKLTETLHTYEFKGSDVLKRTYWFLLEYSGDEQLIPQMEEQITEARWITRDEFTQIRQDTFASIHEVLDSLEGILNRMMLQ
jgi:ADP-ribose pyrophosphatase YjhB (NUDIX family)